MKNFIKKLGDVLTILLPVASLPLVYFINGWVSTVFLVVVYIIGNLIVQLIKGVCDSPRPRENKGDHVIYIHGYSHNDGESCCSGHAVSAALPTYFVMFFISPTWVFIPFFVLSCVCSWTRVYVKAHWILDVMLSNIIALNLNLLLAYILKVI